MDHAPARTPLRLVPGEATSAPRRRPEPLLRVAVGSVLRAERAEQQRTLADVAAAARVSLPYLSEVERGRKEPSSEVLAAVCAALDLTLVDLLARTASALPGAGRSGVTLSLAA